MNENNHVIVSEEPMNVGKLGVIRLNRPEKLNALNINMCEVLNNQLAKWEIDPELTAVVILGEGDKAFCAGGDVKAIYEIGQKDPKEAMHFFSEEYQLNRRIHHFPKPYISFVHGVCMGGGLGVSTHASHRVAATDLRMAMPETKIGFYPDVGATFFLSRCPGELGAYMGLTGNDIDAADALYVGLIDHVVEKKHFQKMLNELKKLNQWDDISVHKLLENFSTKTKKRELSLRRDIIDQKFSGETIQDILTALDTADDSWSTQMLDVLLSRSPTSIQVTLQALRKAKTLEFNDCMAMEFRLTEAFVQGHDFYEGIKCAVIAKGSNPVWKPSSISEVEIFL